MGTKTKKSTKAKRAVGPRTSIDSKEFIVLWNHSASVEAVASAFKTSKTVVQAKASYLRKKGVTSLKKFHRDSNIDFAELNKLAADSLSTKPTSKNGKAARA